VDPFRWQLDGKVQASFTRAFRDGSLGILVRFTDLSASVQRPGAAPVPVPVGLEGAWLELRAFPQGDVLRLTGASRWAGEKGHLEVLDGLWPALSPRLPERGAPDPLVSSWPNLIPGGPQVRDRLEAHWQSTRAGGAPVWTYAGTVSGEGGPVQASGPASGRVTLRNGVPRVDEHTFDWARTVSSTWGGGARVTQEWHTTGSLRHAGTAPAPLLDMPIGSDDASIDALPLKLRDGGVAEDPPVDITADLPFLLLPDDLSAADRARVHATLTGTGRVGRQEP
jgi:hypothetical protein